MSKLTVSFYVLSESKAQDFLGFICQLTQTALNKSTQSLVILADNELLLSELDEALWANDAASFIPHQRLSAADSETTASTAVNSTAPVLLASQLPPDFSGIVINTTPRPLTDYIPSTSNALPNRLLEIILPDDDSVAQGRHKYKHYQQLDYELTHFKV
ncbi:DNA polymerase III subunit chi [Psychrobacter sp. 2Y5]|uniref:DNA polymerase III subunit chi n=1 Tax=unclassified Psychrobacter TaxID=196806 RepID=UPI003F480E07